MQEKDARYLLWWWKLETTRKLTGKCLTGRTITHEGCVSTRKWDKVTLCSQPAWLRPPGVGQEVLCWAKPRPHLPSERSCSGTKLPLKPQILNTCGLFFAQARSPFRGCGIFSKLRRQEISVFSNQILSDCHPLHHRIGKKFSCVLSSQDLRKNLGGLFGARKLVSISVSPMVRIVTVQGPSEEWVLGHAAFPQAPSSPELSPALGHG